MTTPQGTLNRDSDGREYWSVAHVDALRPFLISLTSATDVWAYISTSGGLTGGRVDASRALFPYETDDRLHHAGGVSGPLTLIRVGPVLWQPFDPRGVAPGRRRTLRKAAEGHWVEFEEQAPDLGLTFRMRWTCSRRFGLIRRCTLEGDAAEVELLDGLLNVIPAGVPRLAQQGLSALVDAYKRNELLDGGVGLYAMDAYLSDEPAPAEAMRANVIWRRGLPTAQTLLSADAVQDMRSARPSDEKTLWFGERGAYFVRAVVCPDDGPLQWDMVGDVHLDHVGLAELLAQLRRPGDVDAALEADLEAGWRALRDTTASADGLQCTGDRAATIHHFANVVFNNMRGGVFAHGQDVPVRDLRDFLRTRNRAVAARHDSFLDGLGGTVPHPLLVSQAEATTDPQLVRLCLEYLPLVFSRRHGDPSRPWNAFSIRLRHADGRPIYHYEGNWRDIFQNWEALCRSFPAFLVPIVAKFVNATTVDGFNPYRITRAGVDWEVPDPDDPWASIGYWGDHQIVYLFRMLEAAEEVSSGSVRRLLCKPWFSAADVPYRLRPYDDLLTDAKDTIRFDVAAHEAAEVRAAAVGGDGRLLPGPDGEPMLVQLIERLLVLVLAKLSNLVVDGGIWLNTQRPEWNDANNALVGAGLSMVTLAQLRRAIAWLGPICADGRYAVSPPVRQWFDAVTAALSDHAAIQVADGKPVDPTTRRALMDTLGKAFCDYRAAAYAGGLAGTTPLQGAEVRAMCAAVLPWLDHSLRTNRRADGLVHSYNLLRLSEGRADIDPLYEMLEGQVNVLGSGVLSPAGAVEMLEALFGSRLYRADQKSFMLYPFRDRPDFLERNAVPAEWVRRAPLLAALSEAGDRSLLAQDVGGTWRFSADVSNADDLSAALDELAADPAWAHRIATGRQDVLDAYEATFHHHAFTGRSGTMYKYEGLGSIYWHMVSKLLVAVQECWRAAADAGAPEADALAGYYFRVRDGLSFRKTVQEYGAIPTDPYSHTPWHLGAQQPGMTGQVKEEILTRLGELGMWARNGELHFDVGLLPEQDRTREPSVWDFPGLAGPQRVEVPAGAVAFSFCQVPVVVQTGAGEAMVRVEEASGSVVEHRGAVLDARTTARLRARDASIRVVRVSLP